MRVNYQGHDKTYQRLREQNAVGWDQTHGAYDERFQILREELAHEHCPKTGRIMELGCGAGNVALWLHAQGYQVTGVDISQTAIEWAQEKAGASNTNIDFHHCGVLNMTAWSPALFDIAYDSHCLHCIIGEDRQTMIDETRRLLKPGGLFLVDTMCGPVTPDSLEGFDPQTGIIFHGDIATRYIGEPEAIMDEITSSGFKIISQTRRKSNGHQNLFLHAQKR